MSSMMCGMLLGAGVVSKKTYVDDVFSTYLYKGTGSSLSINNGSKIVVSSNENKLVSSLLDSITSVIISEFLNFLATDEPTSPLLPKIKALIFHLIKFYSKKIIT